FGRGFSANANSVFSGITANADGTRSKLSGGDILAGGLGQGAGDAADTVSKYLIERAEQYQPVVEMPTGIDVEIVFLDGVFVRNAK
ncbi:MAG: conjugal transfer protein TraB, partial [Novosphingobium sp.]|nr:conjugal transfer protein TraB [Novosphingobium sp.]